MMCYSHLSYDDIHIATYKPHAVFKSWGKKRNRERIAVYTTQESIQYQTMIRICCGNPLPTCNRSSHEEPLPGWVS